MSRLSVNSAVRACRANAGAIGFAAAVRTVRPAREMCLILVAPSCFGELVHGQVLRAGEVHAPVGQVRVEDCAFDDGGNVAG